MPDERCYAVERAWRGGEPLKGRTEATFPIHHVVVPELAEQPVVLHRERERLAPVLSEPRVDRGGVAAAKHEVHATVR